MKILEREDVEFYFQGFPIFLKNSRLYRVSFPKNPTFLSKSPTQFIFVETVLFNLYIFIVIQEVKKIEPLKSIIRTGFFEFLK